MIEELFKKVKKSFEDEGKLSSYSQDAHEIDPRYHSLGVRSDGKNRIHKKYKTEIASMSSDEKIMLSLQLVDSGIAELQGFGIEILSENYKYIKQLTPPSLIDNISGKLFGWSKIDGFAGGLMKDILLDDSLPATEIEKYIKLIKKWSDSENHWQRRLSVVCFSWGTAYSGKYIKLAMELCEKLKFDKEKKVLQGVGWCLSNHIKVDREGSIEILKRYYQEKVSGIITSYNSHYLTQDEKKYIRS